MNEPFIIEDEDVEAPRESGFNLTGWEAVIFQLEDDELRRSDSAPRCAGATSRFCLGS